MLLQLLISTTPERSSGWGQTWGCHTQGKTGRTSLQIIRYFKELISWAQVLYLLISKKALQSFMVNILSLQSKGLSRVFFNTTVQKHQFFGTQPSSQSNSHIYSYMTIGKSIALTRRTLVGKVMQSKVCIKTLTGFCTPELCSTTQRQFLKYLGL